MRLESREVVDGALAVRRRDHKRDFARTTLLHAASTTAMESVKVPSQNSVGQYTDGGVVTGLPCRRALLPRRR